MNHTENEAYIRAEALAGKILILARNTLLVNLRFLDMALSRLEPHPAHGAALATDGEKLLYDPMHILRSYKGEKEVPIRDYLHVLLHCIYRHMFVRPAVQHELWDLACDITAENAITELGVPAAAALREGQQRSTINDLKKHVKYISAEKLYSYFRENPPSLKQLAAYQALFCADDHSLWYAVPEESDGGGQPQSADGGQPQSADGGQPQSDGSGQPQSADGRQSQSGSARTRAAVAEDWKEIAERMQQDLETFSKQHGDRAGSLVQNLAEVNREKYDYTAFLKKFAVMGERMQINDDEFDYIFYTYGLQLYQKIPLIEPLEYKEVKRIREFVIAIDTSGSVEGELVQTFLQKTYNIMKSTESFFSRVNIHILQCDAEIQEHVKITSQKAFDDYMKNMRIRGFGGTDFRPVFSFVDQLCAQKEFQNLKGLIYFTDGYGTFPEKMPAYPTAFLFVQDDFEIPAVPPWAIRLLLQREEI